MIDPNTGINEETAGATQASGCCGCAGVGPMVSEFFRRFGPPEGARHHFQQARIEFLKGIRAVIDQRINDLSRSAPSKGTHVTVE